MWGYFVFLNVIFSFSFMLFHWDLHGSITVLRSLNPPLTLPPWSFWCSFSIQVEMLRTVRTFHVDFQCSSLPTNPRLMFSRLTEQALTKLFVLWPVGEFFQIQRENVDRTIWFMASMASQLGDLCTLSITPSNRE